MAKRAPEATRTNPEVRFERSDIEARGIVKFGFYLSAGIGLVVVSMLWFGDMLLVSHRTIARPNLPPAAMDEDRLPPEPRLEGLEDIRENKPRMFPPRAQEYYAPQVEQLKVGGATVTPIESAMDAVSKSLPVRKTGDKAAPMSFTTRLPSKASSGRVETGGR